MYAQDNKGSTTYQHDQPINDFAKPNAQFAFDRNQSMNDSNLTYAQDNNYAQTDIQFSPDSGQTKHNKSHTSTNSWNWHSNLKVSIFTPFFQASLICSTNKHSCTMLHFLQLVQNLDLSCSSLYKFTPVKRRTNKLNWQQPTQVL